MRLTSLDHKLFGRWRLWGLTAGRLKPGRYQQLPNPKRRRLLIRTAPGLITCGRPGKGETLHLVEITLVKAAGPGDRDRAWLTTDGAARRGAIHVIHDLPHLVVESLFGISDGLWAELAAGTHAEAAHAASARDPKRHKQGRIVSGAAAGVPAREWLTTGHRRAKAITNCVANRWGDGPDTPAGVRGRVARQDDPALQDLLAHIDDEIIAAAIRGVRTLEQRWMAVAPGGTLRLSWPLERGFLA